MPGRHKTPVQQAWEYARDIKGAKWVLVSNYIELRLYAVSETSLVYETFKLAELTNPQQYARFILLLHADNLLTGNTEQLLGQSLLADKEITTQLYADYKSLREQLITHLIRDNPNTNATRLIAPAQKLLDRFLFVAFAEDKGLIPEFSIQQAFEHADPYNKRPIYENFKGLFRAIDKGNSSLSIPAYNGGLFATDTHLDNLTVVDDVCHAVNEIAKYDFDSEVSVTVLGHIFEQSISDLENLTLQIEQGELPAATQKGRAVSGKRKRQGIVYTPDHITAFIVEHTLGSHINQRFEQLLGEYGKFKKDQSIQWKKGSKTELRFWYAWQQTLQNIKVVDPACGSGAFLVAAFDYLHAEYQRINDKLAELTGQHSMLDLNKEVLSNNLYGVDINPESIEISKLSLWLKTAERGKSLTTLDHNLITGNSLGLNAPAPGDNFYWKAAFPDIFKQGGFDVVLGNPPYVRQELISHIKPWLEENYAVYHGVADLYAYFFELGYRILKPEGRMSYISSSTFFKTGSGETLRRFLAEKTTLEKIVDFGDLQIFEGVTTYPAIVVLKKSPPIADDVIEILQLENELPINLPQHFAQQKGSMKQARLSEKSWQIEDEALSQLRQKLVLGHQTLKEVYGSPYRGVLTGLNAAFVIDRKTRDQLVAEDPASKQLLKPFLEGKDLKKWHSQPRDLWLIFTKRGTDLGLYPAIKKHLMQYRERLEPKPKDWPQGEKWPGRKAGPYKWYEIQDTVAYSKHFDAIKIQYAHFCAAPLFHCNKDNAYSNDKSYILRTDDGFILGLLNSKTIWFLIKALCPFVRGGYYELRAQYIETLPIPTASTELKKRIKESAQMCQSVTEERYTIENNFRRRLPDLCPPETEPKLNTKLKNWWLLDFNELQKAIKTSFKTTIPIAERNAWQDYFETEKEKIAILKQQITQLESQLNQAVYKLFNLNASEISLIES
ncbi:MAG: N-6 DNA methylase [Xanthomonadales bacterium]|nr:N-6 DNA methylase [Xanthomonadales bacterium]